MNTNMIANKKIEMNFKYFFIVITNNTNNTNNKNVSTYL
jgi:hypothetical protein